MRKTKIFLTIIFLNLFFTLCGILSVSSGDSINDPPPGNSYLIGRVYQNNADILFNRVSVNEFILCSNCGGCNFKYSFFAPSSDIKTFLLNSTGKQVILSGKFLSIPFDKLKQENPSSRCLETPAGQNISFFSVGKAEYISFYDHVIPEKINWDEPVKLKFHFKNPFEHKITLNIDLFSIDSHVKEKLILNEKEVKAMEVNFNFSKQDWARSFGAAIVLEITASPENGNYLIYFSDKIASYDAEGGLIFPAE